jgi:hypothetical protein
MARLELSHEFTLQGSVTSIGSARASQGSGFAPAHISGCQGKSNTLTLFDEHDCIFAFFSKSVTLFLAMQAVHNGARIFGGSAPPAERRLLTRIGVPEVPAPPAERRLLTRIGVPEVPAGFLFQAFQGKSAGIFKRSTLN